MSAIKTFFDVTRYAFGPERASSTTRPLLFEPPSDVPATFHPSITYTTQLFMCAYYGVTGWFFEVDDFATEEQRLYSVSPAAVKVLQTNFAFQTWDFAVSFLHKELNAPEMLAHHSLAALGAGPACAFGAAFGSAFGAGAFPRGTVSGGKSIGSGSGRLGTAVATSKCHSRSCHAIQSV